MGWKEAWEEVWAFFLEMLTDPAFILIALSVIGFCIVLAFPIWCILKVIL